MKATKGSTSDLLHLSHPALLSLPALSALLSFLAMKGHCNGENMECLFDNEKTVITVSFDISEPPPKGASQSNKES